MPTLTTRRNQFSQRNTLLWLLLFFGGAVWFIHLMNASRTIGFIYLAGQGALWGGLLTLFAAAWLGRRWVQLLDGLHPPRARIARFVISWSIVGIITGANLAVEANRQWLSHPAFSQILTLVEVRQEHTKSGGKIPFWSATLEDRDQSIQREVWHLPDCPPGPEGSQQTFLLQMGRLGYPIVITAPKHCRAINGQDEKLDP